MLIILYYHVFYYFEKFAKKYEGPNFYLKIFIYNFCIILINRVRDIEESMIGPKNLSKSIRRFCKLRLANSSFSNLIGRNILTIKLKDILK